MPEVADHLAGELRGGERHVASGEDDPAFVTDPTNRTPPRRQNRRNIESRTKDAIKRANVRLAELGIEPISERVSPHSLRRTYASLRAACGDDPVYIAEQGGWKDPTFALRVYAKSVRRRSKLSGAHLREFDRAIEWATISAGTAPDPSFSGSERAARPIQGTNGGTVTDESPANHA